jgi:dihydroorotase
LEFDLADFGMIGLQTAFSSLLSIKSALDIDLSLEKLGNGARQAMNIAPITIEEGQPACLAIFDPKKKWIFNARTNKSKSTNSPLYVQELTGRCVGLINGEKSYFLKR